MDTKDRIKKMKSGLKKAALSSAIMLSTLAGGEKAFAQTLQKDTLSENKKNVPENVISLPEPEIIEPDSSDEVPSVSEEILPIRTPVKPEQTKDRRPYPVTKGPEKSVEKKITMDSSLALEHFKSFEDRSK